MAGSALRHPQSKNALLQSHLRMHQACFDEGGSAPGLITEHCLHVSHKVHGRHNQQGTRETQSTSERHAGKSNIRPQHARQSNGNVTALYSRGDGCGPERKHSEPRMRTCRRTNRSAVLRARPWRLYRISRPPSWRSASRTRCSAISPAYPPRQLNT